MKVKCLRRKNEKGFMLLEILIAISILLVLVGIFVSQLTTQADNAKIDEAKLGMSSLSQSLQMYRLHHGKYPSTGDGLRSLSENISGDKKWRGPYVESSKLKDPWGIDYAYESDGSRFKITSGGPGGVVGDSDDVSYPEEVNLSSGG